MTDRSLHAISSNFAWSLNNHENHSYSYLRNSFRHAMLSHDEYEDSN
jgi:hypothetical protein